MRRGPLGPRLFPRGVQRAAELPYGIRLDGSSIPVAASVSASLLCPRETPWVDKEPLRHFRRKLCRPRFPISGKYPKFPKLPKLPGPQKRL